MTDCFRSLIDFAVVDTISLDFFVDAVFRWYLSAASAILGGFVCRRQTTPTNASFEKGAGKKKRKREEKGL